ncbi:MAG TPA: hypothetical protein PKH07_18130, partial [bacterium]|nr:hypothetical protein [bacterium]
MCWVERHSVFDDGSRLIVESSGLVSENSLRLVDRLGTVSALGLPAGYSTAIPLLVARNNRLILIHAKTRSDIVNFSELGDLYVYDMEEERFRLRMERVGTAVAKKVDSVAAVWCLTPKGSLCEIDLLSGETREHFQFPELVQHMRPRCLLTNADGRWLCAVGAYPNVIAWLIDVETGSNFQLRLPEGLGSIDEVEFTSRGIALTVMDDDVRPVRMTLLLGDVPDGEFSPSWSFSGGSRPRFDPRTNTLYFIKQRVKDKWWG